MKNQFDTTEPRFQRPFSNQAKSYINNNKIMKILRKAKHTIEFIPDWDWANWRKKHNLT